MARKLTFGTPPPPKPLKFDDWQPVKGKAKLVWLPDDEFDVLARRHGKDPRTTVGLATWGGWFGDRIYIRARSLTGVTLHEVHHIETQSNFHEGDGT